jgi:class 3 adenylate cyclase
MTPQASIRFTQTDDGAEIAYAVVGSGVPAVFAGPVAAAGIDVSLASDRFMSRFQPLLENHSLVLFDWRGLGASGPAPSGFSLEAFVSDLESVVKAVSADQVDLVGQAALAHVAIEYAARHPKGVRRLALAMFSAGGNSPRVDGRFADLHVHVEKWPLFAELYSLAAYGWTDIELARVSRARLESRFDSGLWIELMSALESIDSTARGPELSMPLSIHLVEGITTAADVAGARRLVATAADGRVQMHPAVSSEITSRADGPAVLAGAAAFLREGLSVPGAGQHNVQTVLFTDLAGSTDMYSRLGDEAARAIVGAHDSAFRRAIAEFDGREVKHTGDGIMASFDSPVDAVRCALAVRHEIEVYNDTHDAEGIHVRFGLNSGEPMVDPTADLFGLSVTLASRIANWGEPGRVLVSDVVRQLLLGKGFQFDGVGEIELKGFPEPVAIFEVSE